MVFVNPASLLCLKMSDECTIFTLSSQCHLLHMFHLVNDLFLELIALCNPISSHTLSFWTNLGILLVSKSVHLFPRIIFQVLWQKSYFFALC